MLFIVLILVLAALGLLITALISASQTWAWVSIALSLAAALVLMIDWLRRRGREGAAEEVAGDDAGAEEAQPEAGGSEPVAVTAADESADAAEKIAEEPAGRPEDGTGATEPVVASGRDSEHFDELDEVPGEEDTDAADLLIVCDLDDQVIVVDEYPRYHLAGCDWLADRDAIPIAVAEARELGFTPCLHCGPDSALAAKHRKRQNVRR